MRKFSLARDGERSGLAKCSPAARKSIGKFFATAGQDHRLGLDRGSSVRTSAESRERIQQLPKKIPLDAVGMVQPFASSGTLNSSTL